MKSGRAVIRGSTESRSKKMKKKQESSLEKLSSWYQDGGLENRQDGGDKSGSRGSIRAEEGDRRKTSSKLTHHEDTQSESRSKEENPMKKSPKRHLVEIPGIQRARKAGREDAWFF
ncbi:methyltransferase-like protein 1 [Pyrus ussuriensis x Pyrus communis]|uniref:Methyltransferase-like protein 1 n=1 Tax=Pyrus ussuriensis x Pyrus communis TaxID=2448454 RepID=A0A5N5F0Z1_9ROSA|nr:methyltransferase-like protein 1 [Pyrus ussuriensis x Pyrus communis]